MAACCRSAGVVAIALMLLGTTGISAAKKSRKDERGSELTAEQKAELARVSIVRYQDATGTRNFGYMPDSLTEAIDKSLQLRFEYKREDPDKTEGAVTAFKIKNPQLNAQSAADFCKINKTDILIYGDFTFDGLTNEIVVNTYISLGAASKFRHIEERRNPVNATIFKLADLVADDIVRNLTEIAKEQSPEKLGAKLRKDEKLELKKIRTTAWSETNWNFTPGFSILVPLNSSFSGYRTPQPMMSLLAERRLFRGLYFGLQGSVLPARISNIALDFFTAAAFAAYHWQLSARWDIFVQAGAGYYTGRYYNNTTCYSNCTANSTGETFPINNPYFMARSGFNFLIFSWLSLGIFGQGDLFYDKPTPLYFAGGGASIGVHF